MPKRWVDAWIDDKYDKETDQGNSSDHLDIEKYAKYTKNKDVYYKYRIIGEHTDDPKIEFLKQDE